MIVLAADVSPKVVLNNPGQAHPAAGKLSANMLAIVDGVPRPRPGRARALGGSPDGRCRSSYPLPPRQAEEEAHILRGLLKALDALDEVIALIRRSPTADEARSSLDGVPAD